MIAVLYVFIGGGLGSVCRYGVSLLFSSESSHYGTLLANAIACFLLGILIGLQRREILRSHHRLLLATGFCGGFSTFSTFSGEMIHLGQSGALMAAVFYGFLSIIIGLLGIVLGIWFSRFCMA